MIVDSPLLYHAASVMIVVVSNSNALLQRSTSAQAHSQGVVHLCQSGQYTFAILPQQRAQSCHLRQHPGVILQGILHNNYWL
jgi:hypothetical protein